MPKPRQADVVIYHNPACGQSRKTLALLREAGIEPKVVEYLKSPPSRGELRDLARRMDVPLAALLREKGTPHAELGLGRAGIGDDEILDAIARHPILIQRPIVVTELGARICRPPDLVHDILPKKP